MYTWLIDYLLSEARAVRTLTSADEFHQSMTSTRRMTSSFRRRKNPPNQQLVAMRHLDSAPNTAGTGSDFGVTSPDNKTTATKMAAATSAATVHAANMAANMASKMAATTSVATERAAKMAANMATKMAAATSPPTEGAAKMAANMATKMVAGTSPATEGAAKMAANMATKMAAATYPATKGAAKMATNMATKMAAADLLDTVPKPRRPSLMDVRKVLSLDDFDAFCVQASSGGSVYGMLRKQIFQDGKKVPPGKRMMERQRSKSLTKTQGPRRRRFHRVTEGHALTSGLLGHPGVIVGQTDALRQRPEEG